MSRMTNNSAHSSLYFPPRERLNQLRNRTALEHPLKRTKEKLMTWTSATSTLNYDRLLQDYREKRKSRFSRLSPSRWTTIRKPPFSTTVGIEQPGSALWNGNWHRSRDSGLTTRQIELPAGSISRADFAAQHRAVPLNAPPPRVTINRILD